jgi:hypothetical protein
MGIFKPKPVTTDANQTAHPQKHQHSGKRHETLEEYQMKAMFGGNGQPGVNSDSGPGNSCDFCGAETFLDNAFCEKHMNGRHMR